MRRVVAAIAALVAALVGTEQPAHATEATVVSGVSTFSPALYVGLEPLGPTWTTWLVTMTETQQGVFVAGLQSEVASLACTFSGSALESYGLGYGALSGSCWGRGVTGVQVTKSCTRTYLRSAQYLVYTDDCQLHVGSATATSSTITDAVAHLPPPPTDRYYYTGTATGLSS